MTPARMPPWVGVLLAIIDWSVSACRGPITSRSCSTSFPSAACRPYTAPAMLTTTSRSGAIDTAV